MQPQMPVLNGDDDHHDQGHWHHNFPNPFALPMNEGGWRVGGRWRLGRRWGGRWRSCGRVHDDHHARMARCKEKMIMVEKKQGLVMHKVIKVRTDW